MERQTQINVWYLVIAVLGVMWLGSLWKEARTVEPITYSEFVGYLKEGKIAEVVIRENIVEGTFKEPQPDKRTRFVAVRVDENIAKDLQQYDVKFTGVIENTFLRDMLGWVIPALVFFGLWWFVMRKFAEKQGLGGGFGFGHEGPSIEFFKAPFNVFFRGDSRFDGQTGPDGEFVYSQDI